MKYFSNKPTALGNNLLGQNTQDLRKSLDDIKQQNIELDKDEGNSTNNKNENDNDNVSIWYWVLLTDFINLFSINFCQINNQYQTTNTIKHLNSNEISKPLWIKISRSDFIPLIKHVVDNLDDRDCRTTVDKRKDDFKNGENFFLEITTKKICRNDARKL